MNAHLPPSRIPSLRFVGAALAAALLAFPFTARSQNYTASSNNSTAAITISSGNHTISVGSSGALTRSNAITLSGGTLQGGIMDNVATVSNLSGSGTASTYVDANGVTIILRGNGTSATTANLTLASGVSVTGANQLLVGGGAGGGGGRDARNDGGGGGGGFVVLTTGNLSGTVALTAGGGSAGASSGGGATASGGNSSIGATTASGGGGAASSTGTPTGKGGDSGQNISGSSSSFTGGNGSRTPPTTGNGGGGGGAGSSANGANAPGSHTAGGAGGNGTTITTGVVGLSTYMGSDTFGGGGGGGANTTGGAGGTGGGGAGAAGGVGVAGTDGLGGGGGGGAAGSGGFGGAGGAGSVAVQYAYDSNVAAGNLTLTGGITLSSTSTLDAVRSGGLIDITTTAISGTGDLNIASSASSGGVVRFSVANTYSGTTTINSGATLELGHVDALQNTTLDIGTSGSQEVTFSVAGANTYNIGAIQGGDTLDFGANTISVGANNATTSFTGTLAGSGGSLTKAGTGTLTLSATNTYSGTTTISAGTIQIDHANALGSGGNITFSGGGLKYGTGITQDLSSRIKNSGSAMLVDTNGESITWGTALDSTNSGGLTKNGTGTLTLSATNTYTGSTTVNAGTLSVSGNIANSGLVINSGGIISPGTTAAADSFGTSSITINGGGYNWTLNTANGSAGTGYDQITSTGALTSSGLLTVYAYGTPGDWDGSASYDWDIFNAGSVSGFSAGNFSVDLNNFGIAAGNRTGTWSFSNPSGGIIRLTYTPSADPAWTGGNGNFSSGFSPAVSNGDDVFIAGAGGGTATNDSYITSLGNMTFMSGIGAYTIAGSAFSVTGAITNNDGSNIQTLNTNVTPGSIVINAGTLQVGAAGRLSSGTYSGTLANEGIFLYSGTAAQTLSGVISGTGALTKNAASTLTLAGNNTYSGATTINAGTLEIGAAGRLGGGSYAGNIANDGALIYSGTAAQTLSGMISGTGALTKNAASTLTLSGNNTYSGATTINAGTFEISAAGRLGGGTYAGNIANNGALIYSGTAAQTLSGMISGTGALTQNAASTLTLSGNNTYSGATTINAGTFEISAAGRLGGGSYAGNIANDGALIYSGTAAQTLSGVISGSGALTHNAASTLTLSGSNTYTGTTTLSAGTIQIGHANALGSGGDVTFSGGELKYGTGVTADLSSRIKNSGSAILVDTNGESVTWGTNLSSTNTGGLTKNGSGTLRINVQSAYSGATAINGGTLQIYNAVASTAWNPGVIAINNASTLEFTGIQQTIFQNADDTITFDSGGGGSMIMTKNLIWRNSYIVTTGGAMNTISGTYFNNQGNTSYHIFYDTAVGSGAVALEVSSDHQLGIIKNGLGKLVLTNSLNNMGDSTVINAGTLEIGASGRLQSGSYAQNITNNGTFSYNSTADQTLSGVISGSGVLTKNAASTLTLSGSNTYSGGTTLNSGTLVIGNAAAAGSGTITQTDGTSLLTFDTTGTIANAMSIHNVSSNKTVTLTGSITAQNTTYDVASGTTLSINGSISGTGGVTKDGDGTLELNAANTFTGDTEINFGTLEANATGSLASTGNITVTGGSLLVGANNAINDSAAMNLAGGNLTFSGNINETVGALTLSANSVIDMGGGNVALEFSNLVAQLTSTTRLNIYNYTLYSDHLYFTNNANVSDSLQYISFYSGFGTGFIGNSFISSFSSPWQVQPVPEPETWATAALLLIGGGIYLLRRKITA